MERDRSEPGAVILAGGGSTRMGQPKAWLDVQGEPLLLRVVRTTLAAGCRSVVVGRRDVALPPLPEGVCRVNDPEPGPGTALLGVHTGLTWLHEVGIDRTFLTGCDAILLHGAHISFMLARLVEAPNAEAVVPRSCVDGVDMVQPLASAVRVAPALFACATLMSEGGVRLQDLFGYLSTTWLPADDLPRPESLQDCNTPAALARALTKL